VKGTSKVVLEAAKDDGKKRHQSGSSRSSSGSGDEDNVSSASLKSVLPDQDSTA